MTGSGDDIPREHLDWSTYGVAVRELATAIADSDFQPELILGIARGGLFVAGSLGYALSVKNTFLVNVEYYTGVDERLDVPVMLPPYLDPSDLQDLRVLIADDVADTGHTLELVKQFCAERVAEVRVAVLYQKPRSVVDADYAWKLTERWINFPWSTLPPVVEPRGRALVRDA